MTILGDGTARKSGLINPSPFPFAGEDLAVFPAGADTMPIVPRGIGHGHKFRRCWEGVGK